MAPRSIAVVGASHRPDSFGRFVMANVLSAGFSGEVFAVNPKHRAIDGRPCLPSLQALPQKVDLAVVVTAARHVPGIVDDAAARGIPTMLVLSPGLCDQGPDVPPDRAGGRAARAPRQGAPAGPELPGADAAGHRPQRQLGAHDGAARRHRAGLAVGRGDDGAARLRVDRRFRLLVGAGHGDRVRRRHRRDPRLPGGRHADPLDPALRRGHPRRARFPVERARRVEREARSSC